MYPWKYFLIQFAEILFRGRAQDMCGFRTYPSLPRIPYKPHYLFRSRAIITVLDIHILKGYSIIIAFNIVQQLHLDATPYRIRGDDIC